MSLDVDPETMQRLLRRTAMGLFGAGFGTVALVTGHYAQGHSLELFRLAEEFNRDSERPAIIAASPLEPLEDDTLLDHAAKWETAQLLISHPDLVRLDLLPEVLTPKGSAVLGESPREADRKAALETEGRALSIWETWIKDSLAGNFEALTAFYARRKERYASYESRYFRDSWEQAIREWWQDQP